MSLTRGLKGAAAKLGYWGNAIFLQGKSGPGSRNGLFLILATLLGIIILIGPNALMPPAGGAQNKRLQKMKNAPRPLSTTQ
jgi:hypothetical protein